jgi:hypothetical protein
MTSSIGRTSPTALLWIDADALADVASSWVAAGPPRF